MPIELGSVLKVIGGNPHQKVGSVIAEKFPITKMLDGGSGLGDLLDQVINGGGLQSLISNPVQVAAGQLQSAIGSATSALSGVSGAGALVTALTGSGGLSTALGSLVSAGNGLLKGPGILDVIGHASIADLAGSALPANLGLDTVLAPVTAGSTLTAITGWVSDMAAQVVAGVLPVADAIAGVAAHTATLGGIVAGSVNARSTVTAMAVDISAASALAASLAAGPPEIQAVLRQALPTDVQEVMQASVAGHLAEPEE